MNTVDLNLLRPGRQKKAPTATIVREITPADIASLRVAGPVKPIPIKSLRDSHHALAKALASGMPNEEASLLTGYTVSRISVLKGDPTFKELLEFYRARTGEEHSVVQGRFESFMMDNLHLLQERIAEEPEKVTSAEARENIKMAAPIAGHGGVTNKNLNLNVNLDLAARLAEARKRAPGDGDQPAGPPLTEAKALPARPPVAAQGGEGAAVSPSPPTDFDLDLDIEV